MIDFALARRTMVDTQVRTNDVTDSRLLNALLAVPRELFVPAAMRPLAYFDMDIPLGSDEPRRYLMQAMVFAKLAQAATIADTDSVLDVGCASGYSAAVLAQLAGRVTALESDGGLASAAAENLRSVANVTVVTGALPAGYQGAAPYDVILMAGAIEFVPEPLLAQLNEGGRLVAVVGSGRSGRATVFVRTRGDFSGRMVFDTATAPLPGFEKPPVFAF
jgi:protein-L-isoaspartate(D-aspartate) O-methyltransferase